MIRGAEIKNCLSLIPKSEYKELIDTKNSFSVVLSSSIIFLVAAFIFYLFPQ